LKSEFISAPKKTT